MRHLPNLICLFRLALIWPVAATLAAGRYALALGLFMLAAVSDGLDGYLAKRFNWTSELGKFLDPMADKFLLMTLFVESAWLGLVPWWITAAAIARDVLIGLGALSTRSLAWTRFASSSSWPGVSRWARRVCRIHISSSSDSSC